MRRHSLDDRGGYYLFPVVYYYTGGVAIPMLERHFGTDRVDAISTAFHAVHSTPDPHHEGAVFRLRVVDANHMRFDGERERNQYETEVFRG